MDSTSLNWAQLFKNGLSAVIKLPDVMMPFLMALYIYRYYYFVSETRRFPARARTLSLSVRLHCSVSGGEEQQRFQLNTDIMLLL